jgi:uncharacterized protein YlaN (UPF0358 family)
MKKVKLLITSLLISSIAFSQTVTDTSKITLTYPIAKRIALDLISGDSAKAILKQKEVELSLVEKKLVYKDSIISLFKIKETNYINQVRSEQQKIEGWQQSYELLRKENRKIKIKSRFTRILSYTIIGGLGYLYITK